MSIKKPIIAFAISIVLIFCWTYYYRSTCEGCGGCGYEKFTDHVMVEKIIWDNDSIHEIYFKSTINTNAVYQMYPEEIDRTERNFTLKEIEDTSKKYTIYGDQISYGTCVPYYIEKMLLDPK